MKKILAVAVMAIALAPLNARAQERVGDAVLGALSGAIVLGPIGAAAGAAVGYVAGPNIARAWGLGRPAPARRQRSARVASSRNQVATATPSTPLPRTRPIEDAKRRDENSRAADANAADAATNATPVANLAPAAVGKSIPAPVASRRKAVDSSQIAAVNPPASTSEPIRAAAPTAVGSAADTPTGAVTSAIPLVPVATLE